MEIELYVKKIAEKEVQGTEQNVTLINIADEKPLDTELLRMEVELEAINKKYLFLKENALTQQAELLQANARALDTAIRFRQAGLTANCLTDEQVKVLSHFFNRHASFEEYAESEIPLPIIEQFLEIKALGIFERGIRIGFHSTDPIAVGRTGDKRWLLARWGDGLWPWKSFMRQYYLERLLIVSLFLFAVVFIGVGAVISMTPLAIGHKCAIALPLAGGIFTGLWFWAKHAIETSIPSPFIKV